MKQSLQIMFLLIAMGAGYTGYQWYEFSSDTMPRLEAERAQAEKAVLDKQNRIRQLQGFIQNIETIKQEISQLSLQLESALEYLPRTFNLASLLRKLTLLAANSGMELQSFKPKGAEEKTAGSFYSAVGIELQMKGTFTQTLVFLDQIARLKRIVNVEILRIRPEAASAATATRSGANIATSNLTVKTYRFSE